MGEGDVYKFNEILKKKVQKGAEACNILIGQAAFLKAEQKIVAFVRLHEPIKGETKLQRRKNKAVNTTAPVVGTEMRGSNELGKGSNDLSRGINIHEILIFEIFYLQIA